MILLISVSLRWAFHRQIMTVNAKRAKIDPPIRGHFIGKNMQQNHGLTMVKSAFVGYAFFGSDLRAIITWCYC